MELVVQFQIYHKIIKENIQYEKERSEFCQEKIEESDYSIFCSAKVIQNGDSRSTAISYVVVDDVGEVIHSKAISFKTKGQEVIDNFEMLAIKKALEFLKDLECQSSIVTVFTSSLWCSRHYLSESYTPIETELFYDFLLEFHTLYKEFEDIESHWIPLSINKSKINNA